MKKILIAYMSVQGHTAQLAEYLAEGVRIAGLDAVLKKVTEFKDAKQMEGYDGYIFGAPTYHRDISEKMKTFLFMANSGKLKGKAGGAFGAYTHSGDAAQIIFDTMEHVYKMKVVNLGAFNVLEDKIGTQEYIRACHDYAKAVCSTIG